MTILKAQRSRVLLALQNIFLENLKGTGHIDPTPPPPRPSNHISFPTFKYGT